MPGSHGGLAGSQTMAGKVVVITGAGSGIGAATARLLADCGANIVLAARSQAKIAAVAAELPTESLAVVTDVTAPADIDRLMSAALDRFGRINALLANAGVYIPGEVAKGDPDAWANLIDVNVTGMMRCVHAVLPTMIAQQSGDIIVTTSISGFVDIHWEPVYSASKHAAQSFVHTLRRQVAADGIRVGSVAPGMVANELWGLNDRTEIDRTVGLHSAIYSEDVAEAILFMLTRPPHLTIRDLVMLPQNQDL